ncbi:hypothetical protein, partial [Klebsiella pneumoniae]|uniref:hypothetical protein n=1 Tax=Klebsiella pneumoniae TaxID=573 RepID=UPI0037125419
ARLQLVRSFYNDLFHAPGVFAERLARAQSRAGEDPAIAEILAFIDAGKKRPLCMPSEVYGTASDRTTAETQ